MWVEMAMDWDDKVRVYQSSLILKTIEGKEGGDSINAFENIVISDIQYLSKTLIVCQKNIINYSLTEAVNFVQIIGHGYGRSIYCCMDLKEIKAPQRSQVDQIDRDQSWGSKQIQIQSITLDPINYLRMICVDQ